MKLEDFIRDYKVYILLGGCIIFLLLFVFIIIQSVRISKLKKKYNRFMQGQDAGTLEEMILKRFDEIDDLKEKTEVVMMQMEEVAETLSTTYQKIGIVKYDAFKEMGGKLSFALAMLDDTNTGFIINSMHSSREGCYTYVKEIIKGESFVVLSEEEKSALDMAINKTNYME